MNSLGFPVPRLVKPLLAISVLTFAVAVGSPAAQVDEARHASPDAVQRHADAMQAFAARRYAVAYGLLGQLADEGDPSAALLALLLVCEGPSMFGGDWSATPGQLQRWSAMAVRHVRERAVAIPEHERGE